MEAIRGQARREQFFQHLKCLAEGNEELTAWMSKGVFSKTSGKLILGPDFCLLS